MNPYPSVRGRKNGSKNKANAEVRELARTYTTVAIKTLAGFLTDGVVTPGKKCAPCDSVDRHCWRHSCAALLSRRTLRPPQWFRGLRVHPSESAVTTSSRGGCRSIATTTARSRRVNWSTGWCARSHRDHPSSRHGAEGARTPGQPLWLRRRRRVVFSLSHRRSS